MVKNLGINIDSNKVYFTKNSPITVMSAPRKGTSGSRKVEAKTNIPREKNKLYFILTKPIYLII